MNYSQKYFVIMGIIFLFMSGFMINRYNDAFRTARSNLSITWYDDYVF